MSFLLLMVASQSHCFDFNFVWNRFFYVSNRFIRAKSARERNKKLHMPQKQCVLKVKMHSKAYIFGDGWKWQWKYQGRSLGRDSGSLQNESGKQESADWQKHTCTLTFAHMETHTGTYKRSFDVWIGLMKPSAKFIAFDRRPLVR